MLKTDESIYIYIYTTDDFTCGIFMKRYIV